MKKLRFGLRKKIIIFCTVFAMILCGSVGYIGYVNYSSNVMQKYKDYAGTLIKFIERKFDRHNMLDVLKENEMNDNYERVRQELNMLKESADVDYIYAVYFPEEGNIDSMSYVINGVTQEQIDSAGSEEEVYSYLGELCQEDDFGREMKECFWDCIQDGKGDIRYYVNKTFEYGYQLTCYKSISNEENEAMIIAVDISMNDIRQNQITYIMRVSLLSVLLLAVFLFVFIEVTNRSVVRPIMMIEESGRDFVEQTKVIVSPDELNFKKVPQCSRDEIEILRRSIEDMAHGIKNYMLDLQRVTEEKGRITAELDVATNIQLSMLPRIFPPFPQKKEFDIYATISTAKEVGGDFYDFYMIDDDHLCVTIADVSGKDVPAALFMVIAKTLLKDHMLLGKTPARAFTDVNNLLVEGNEQSMFVTTWLAVIELSTLKMTTVNAGHNPPLLRKATDVPAGFDFGFLRYILCVIIPYFFIMMFVDYFFPVYSSSRGLSTDIIGYVMLLYGIATSYVGANICRMIPSGKMAAKVISFLMILLAGSIFLFSVKDITIFAVLIVLLIGISDGIMPSMQFNYLYNLPVSRRMGFSKTLGIEGFFSSAIGGLAPIVFGFVMMKGTRGLLVISVLIIITAVIFVLFDKF